MARKAKKVTPKRQGGASPMPQIARPKTSKPRPSQKMGHTNSGY